MHQSFSITPVRFLGVSRGTESLSRSLSLLLSSQDRADKSSTLNKRRLCTNYILAQRLWNGSASTAREERKNDSTSSGRKLQLWRSRGSENCSSRWWENDGSTKLKSKPSRWGREWKNRSWNVSRCKNWNINCKIIFHRQPILWEYLWSEVCKIFNSLIFAIYFEVAIINLFIAVMQFLFII